MCATEPPRLRMAESVPEDFVEFVEKRLGAGLT
jgi:hypothetical protein